MRSHKLTSLALTFISTDRSSGIDATMPQVHYIALAALTDVLHLAVCIQPTKCVARPKKRLFAHRASVAVLVDDSRQHLFKFVFV